MASRFTPRVRPLIALAATGVAIGAAVVTPTFASASPHAAPHAQPRTEPTVASVEQQLGSLAVKNDQLVEQFNKAKLVVAQREKDATRAAGAAKAAAQAYSVQHSQFIQVVQAQYEGSSFGATAALLDSDSHGNYLDRLATLNIISSNTAQLVDNVRAARTSAATASSKADQALASAKAQRTALAQKKSTVGKQIAKYKTLLDTLNEQARQAYVTRDAPPKADTTPRKIEHLSPAQTADAQAAVKFALAQVGKPYVFGAAGPGSYDCSGLTMAAWERGGKHLPHSAEDQYNYGHHVNRADLQPGDLIFFYQPIGHVTIYIGDGMMVSAPTEGEPVKVVSLSHYNGDYSGATRLTR